MVRTCMCSPLSALAGNRTAIGAAHDEGSDCIRCTAYGHEFDVRLEMMETWREKCHLSIPDAAGAVLATPAIA
jgi:hypothetical protein